LNVYRLIDVRQTEIHAANPLVTEPRAFDVELSTEELKIHISPGIDQIPAELFRAGGKTVCCEIHKVIISILHIEKLPEKWKESIIIRIYKKRDKTDCSKCRAYQFCQLRIQLVSNILLSRLTPYAEEIIGDHQCGLRRSRSSTDHIFCTHQILEKRKGNKMKQ